MIGDYYIKPGVSTEYLDDILQRLYRKYFAGDSSQCGISRFYQDDMYFSQ